MQPILVGIVGHNRVGKDTVADLLCGRGFHKVAFADPMRDMLRALMVSQGASTDEVNAALLGAGKHDPNKFFVGRTPRHAMQSLGTEWGRDLMGGRIWSNALFATIERMHWPAVVISDVRFTSEAVEIRQRQGVLVRVNRPCSGEQGSHRSAVEVDQIKVDHELDNTGTLDDLDANVRKALPEFFK